VIVISVGVYGEKLRKRVPDFESRRDWLINIEGIVDSYALLFHQQPSA
jgi:hypothetical protein